MFQWGKLAIGYGWLAVRCVAVGGGYFEGPQWGGLGLLSGVVGSDGLLMSVLLGKAHVNGGVY